MTVAAYDNVALPGPPNIATAGNYAQMLMQGLSGLGDAYQSGKKFQYEQRNQNLFQNGMPTDPNGNPDYGAMFTKMSQSGGAPMAAQLIPSMIGLQQQNAFYNALRGYQPQNTGPASSVAAASPANLTPGAQGGGQPQISSAGMDNAGAETLRSLTAGIAGGRAIPDQFIARFASQLGVDPDTPLSAAQETQARSMLGGNLRGGAQPTGSTSTGGVSAPNRGGIKPVVGTGYEQDEGSTGQGTPVGSTGGSPISPAPTAASGNIGGAPAQRPAPFDQRFNAAYGGGQGGAPSTPIGSLKEAERADAMAERYGTLSGAPGISAQQAAAAKTLAEQWSTKAKQIREQLGEYGKPATNPFVQGQLKQVEADTKYYDSLHRGLTGSGMIAAQQKQNIDMLRQVAASPNFVPGAGSDLALTYQRTLAQLGINPTRAAPREIFNQVSARILADQFSGMKSMAAETGEQGGRIFKSMLDLEERANITHEDSLAGVKSKIDLLDRTGDLMMKWADKADDYKLKHGRLDAGFDKELRADIAKARVPNAVPAAAGWKIERVQ